MAYTHHQVSLRCPFRLLFPWLTLFPLGGDPWQGWTFCKRVRAWKLNSVVPAPPSTTLGTKRIEANILRMTKRQWLVMNPFDIMIVTSLAHTYIKFPRYRDDLHDRHGIEL